MQHVADLGEIADSYDAILCDVWGVVHNGVVLSADAANALASFRNGGGKVVLVTNAPRPAPGIHQQVTAFAERSGVDPVFFDEIVTSGDVTRTAILDHSGSTLFHIGPDRDLGFYDGLDIRMVEQADAELISCTGLFDDTSEGPEDYRDTLSALRDRDLLMICANPDIVVDRGSERIWCAGALAQLYEQLGGKTVLVGKPHKPIYDEAVRVAGVPRDRILAIGDGMHTDIKGANAANIDVLFITSGIHSGEISDRHDKTFDDQSAAVMDVLADHGLSAVGHMQALK